MDVQLTEGAVRDLMSNRHVEKPVLQLIGVKNTLNSGTPTESSKPRESAFPSSLLRDPPSEKQELQLVDKSKTEINFTLWEDDESLNPLIAIKCARVSDFGELKAAEFHNYEEPHPWTLDQMLQMEEELRMEEKMMEEKMMDEKMMEQIIMEKEANEHCEISSFLDLIL